MRLGKIAAVGFGLVALMIGFGLTMVGGTLLTVTEGPDGTISAPSFGVTSDNVALIGDDIGLWVDPDLRGPDFFLDQFKITAEADARNNKDIFIGVGPAQDVRGYLGEAEPDRILVHNDELQVVEGAGSTALTPPAEEDFWTATNREGSLEWRPRTGEWAIVVLNADGTPGIDAVLDVEATVPFLRPVAGALFGLGVFGLGVGAFLLYLGVRSTARAETPPAPTPPRQPADVS